MKKNLREQIEESLGKLLGGDKKLSPEEKDDLRKNCLLAIKWEAVKSRDDKGDWGSGFANGQSGLDDAGNDDD